MVAVRSSVAAREGCGPKAFRAETGLQTRSHAQARKRSPTRAPAGERSPTRAQAGERRPTHALAYWERRPRPRKTDPRTNPWDSDPQTYPSSSEPPRRRYAPCAERRSRPRLWQGAAAPVPPRCNPCSRNSHNPEKAGTRAGQALADAAGRRRDKLVRRVPATSHVSIFGTFDPAETIPHAAPKLSRLARSNAAPTTAKSVVGTPRFSRGD